MFPKPIPLVERRQSLEVALLASGDQEALLQIGDAPLPDGQPLVLTAKDGRFGAVELYALSQGPGEVPVGPLRGRAVTRARWALFSSPERRDHLALALRQVLGLEVEQTSEHAELPPGRKLIFEVEPCRLRLIRVEGAAGTPTPASPAEPSRPTGEHGLRIDPRELASVRVVGHAGQKVDAETLQGRRTRGRQGPRPAPVFRREEARGAWNLPGAAPQPMACGWVGLTHFVFVIPSLGAPEIGTPVEVQVPLSPIAAGFVPISGPISMLRLDENVQRTVVEIDLQGGALPAAYRQLVAHWERANLG